MKIYFVRHGQSEANVSENYNLADTLLTKIGHVQAERTANFFKDKKIVKIFSSDLIRARDTTRKISRKTLIPIIFRDDLKEVNKGIFEGKPKIDEEKAIKNSGEDSLRFKPEGGESDYDGYERVSRFIEELKNMHIKGDIVIISHGGLITLFLLSLLNFPIEEKKYFGVKNCSISVVDVDEEWNVTDLKVNDLTHIVSQSLEYLSKHK